MARVRYDEPMSAHTSWRAGGPADVFFTPRDIEDLATFLRALPADMPVYWVGLGSNLLVRDGGIRGVVDRHPGRLHAHRAALADAHLLPGQRAVRAHRARRA